MPDIPSPPQDDALLYRQCRDAVRTALHCGAPDPSAPGLSERLLVALFSLPEFQRVPIEMNLGGDYTQLEIAEQRGISERTVQRAIYDGLREIVARVYL
jgi:DNA-directed RNA polymerase specialized sigma24 family protein